MKKQGFTLIELIAVIVILSIVLSIAVPSIAGIIDTSTKEAFKSDARMVLKAIDYKKLEASSFDETAVNQNNVGALLNLSNQNYNDIAVTIKDNRPVITIIGTGKWNGLIACGTFTNMRVVSSTSDCSDDLVPPVITIQGNNPASLSVGESYTDAGVIAVDDTDGNITGKIIITGTVNPNVPGTYTINYTVIDMAGNQTVSTRTINVIDNAYPIITYNPNGNNTYAKSRSTTITATDLGIIDNNSLKYVWTTSTTEPSTDSYVNTYVSGDSINTPTDVTGSYYLWAEASDTVSNKTTTRSNAFNIDNTKPIIAMNGNSTVTVNKGSTYSDAGATATDNIDGSLIVTSTGSVNPSVIGTYTITYSVSDSSGNAATSVTRTVNVVDVSAPVITMLGSNPVNINVGSVYSDAGATAIDDVDGDVTSKITVTGTVNPNVVGTYTITYTVKDNANNTATTNRTVNVIDNVIPTVAFGTNGNTTYAKTRSTTVTVSDNVSVNTGSLKYLWNTSTTTPSEASFTTGFTNGGTITSPAGVTGGYYLWILAKDNAGNTLIGRTNVFNLDNTKPVITLTGSSTVTINAGTTYTDAGATATDNIDGNRTSSITTSGSVNANVVGTYTLTYNVSDTSGNAAIPVTRTVTVVDATSPTVAFGTNGNSTYAKTRSTTVTVSDTYGTVNTSSLKYQWTTSTTTPTEASFSTTFTNGGTLTSLAGVTGGYYLWILAKDTSGNTLIGRTNVFNLDNIVPVITMNGSSTITMYTGNTYTDAGATATDNLSGLNGSVTSTGSVNPNVAGTYTITYNVSDNAGNAATPVTRTVIVQANGSQYLASCDVTADAAADVAANSAGSACGSSCQPPTDCNSACSNAASSAYNSTYASTYKSCLITSCAGSESCLSYCLDDTTAPSISLSAGTAVSGYNSLSVTLSISASDSNSGVSKMYISNTGYGTGGAWETYATSKSWTVSGTYDGGTRTIYLQVKDAAGNIANSTVNYTVATAEQYSYAPIRTSCVTQANSAASTAGSNCGSSCQPPTDCNSACSNAASSAYTSTLNSCCNSQCGVNGTCLNICTH